MCLSDCCQCIETMLGFTIIIIIFLRVLFSQAFPTMTPDSLNKTIIRGFVAAGTWETAANSTSAIDDKTLGSRSAISVSCQPHQRDIIVQELQMISRGSGIAVRATTPISFDTFDMFIRPHIFGQQRRAVPPRQMARARRRYSYIKAEIDGINRRVIIRCDDPQHRCEDGRELMYSDGVSSISVCPAWFELPPDDLRYPGRTRFQILFRHLSECRAAYTGHGPAWIPPLTPASDDEPAFVDRTGQLERFLKGKGHVLNPSN